MFVCKLQSRGCREGPSLSKFVFFLSFWAFIFLERGAYGLYRGRLSNHLEWEGEGRPFMGSTPAKKNVIATNVIF